MTKKIFKASILLLTISLALYAEAAQSSEKKTTAHRVAEEFEKLDLRNLPVWDKDVYKKRYKEIRDKKFLAYEGEDRRVPWLYTRDGCHVRATHFINEAKRLGYEAPKKIFIFGVLEIRGAIIPRGAVEPWFHTAPIVNVDGEAMVLDPSISFSRPLTLDKWVSYIAKDRTKAQTIYSLCEPDTYLPTSSCRNPAPLNLKKLEEETQLYLKFERNILRNLGLSFN